MLLEITNSTSKKQKQLSHTAIYLNSYYTWFSDDPLRSTLLRINSTWPLLTDTGVCKQLCFWKNTSLKVQKPQIYPRVCQQSKIKFLIKTHGFHSYQENRKQCAKASKFQHGFSRHDLHGSYHRKHYETPFNLYQSIFAQARTLAAIFIRKIKAT